MTNKLTQAVQADTGPVGQAYKAAQPRPPRFVVFPTAAGWVLRDRSTNNGDGTDYLFRTRAGAVGGMRMRRGNMNLLGSPAPFNVYGEPIADTEVFA